jgi:hypothetical protein
MDRVTGGPGFYIMRAAGARIRFVSPEDFEKAMG